MLEVTAYGSARHGVQDSRGTSYSIEGQASEMCCTGLAAAVHLPSKLAGMIVLCTIKIIQDPTKALPLTGVCNNARSWG